MADENKDAASCKIDDMSKLCITDAEALVGKTVKNVEAGEYNLTLTFADGSTLEVSGATYGDGALDVEFNHADG